MSAVTRSSFFRQVADLFSPIESVLLILDEEGVVLAASRSSENVLGWASEQLVAKNWSVLHHDPFPQGYFSPTAKAHPPVAVRFKRRDGNTFRGRLTDTPVAIPMAGFKGFAASIEDMSEQIDMEEKLAEQRQLAALGQFARSISHRMNNRLEEVIACVELAQTVEDPEQRRLHLNEALRKITACRDTLTDTLREVPGYTEAQHKSDIYRRSDVLGEGQRHAKILIVEDEAVIRKMVSRLLAEDGHEVVSAEDGNQAMLEAVGGHFDLVLTDSAMPGKSGLELVRLLRASQPDARLAVMSGQIYSVAEKSQLREVGADAFLAKPFQVHELREVVASLL